MMNLSTTNRPSVPSSSGVTLQSSNRNDERTEGAKNHWVRRCCKGNKTTNISVATYNCRSLIDQPSGDFRLHELERALESVNVDILGLCETRRNGEEMMQTEGGNVLCWSGSRGARGTGFWVSRRWKDNIVDYYSKSDRISVLILRINRRTALKLIQVYAPTSNSEDEEVESFYDDIQAVIDDDRCGKPIVMGDFNAKIGEKQDNEQCIGNYGYGRRNMRGARLIEFSAANNLKITNSFFKKSQNRKWTWESPNGATKNEIDFILCRDPDLVLDVGIINRFDFDSDHRLLRAKMKINEKRERAKKMRKLATPGNFILDRRREFQLKLSNRFESLHIEDTDDLNVEYSKFTCAIKETTKSLKIEKMSKTKKLTDDTVNLINKREELRKRRRESNEAEVEFTITRKLTKQKIKQDISEFNEKLIEEVIKRNKSLKKAQGLMNPGRKMIRCISKNGNDVTNRREILEEITNFYRELYKNDFANVIIDVEIEEEEKENPTPEILKGEVQLAIREMKNNRSPGEDEIICEMLKAGGETLIEMLTKIFNRILNCGQIPHEWRNADVVVIYKKGCSKNIKNYRPISLLSHLYKVFTRVLQRRIKQTLEWNQPREQAGFRKGYSTIDHLHSINQLIEKYTEYNKTLYLLMIDYEKAFDSVSHTAMLTAVRKQGVRGKIWRILNEIYSDATASIKLETRGPKFLIERGVRQGDPISPVLFTATLEDIFRSCHFPTDAGINIDGERLMNLRFADDIAIFEDDATSMQIIVDELNKQGKKVGLKINNEKTKILTNGQKSLIHINGHVIDYVDDFIYLGQNISFQARQEQEILRRTQNAWKSFWKLKPYLTSRGIEMKNKKRLFDMCILPVLTYGSQTWSLTRSQENKLRTTQRAMERRMIGVTLKDKVRNEEVRRRTGLKDVVIEAKHLKWKWAGHVIRRPDNRWSHRTTVWIPREGKRNRGGQRKRWRDELPRNWRLAASDRATWIRITREAIFRKDDNG